MKRIIENERARMAYEYVKNSIDTGNYKGYVENIAMYIFTNGLGNTIAFIETKLRTEEAYAKLYDNIRTYFNEWIIGNGYMETEYLGEEKISKRIILLNSQEYRIVTKELLKLFEWMKKYVKGY